MLAVSSIHSAIKYHKYINKYFKEIVEQTKDWWTASYTILIPFVYLASYKTYYDQMPAFSNWHLIVFACSHPSNNFFLDPHQIYEYTLNNNENFVLIIILAFSDRIKKQFALENAPI